MLNRHAEHDAAPPSGFALPDVGLYIDDARSIAAVSRPSAANPSLHVASLHSTVLYVHGDGSASLGGTDDPNAAEFTEFVRDEVESGFEPGDLVAMTLRCLLAEVAGSVGTDPTAMAAAATFPAAWTAERVSDVRVAMNRHGLAHVALVSETEALATWADTTQATWAGSDSGIAAARGAATIASHYPVEPVTEEIRVARTTRPALASSAATRTPILAAVAFAAVLALGGGVASLVLNDSSSPAIPEIEGAPVAAQRTTATPAPPVLPFPTVVPILEPVLPAPAQAAEPTIEELPTRDATPAELPRTRPASEAPNTTVEEVPVEESPAGETPTPTDPVPTNPGDEVPTGPTPGDDSGPLIADPDKEETDNPDSPPEKKQSTDSATTDSGT